MRLIKIAFAMSAMIATAACGGEAEPRAAADLAWLDSLTLAVPAPVDTAVASPMELGLVEEAAPALVASAPAAKAAKSSSRASEPRRSSASRRSSSGGSYSAPAPARQPRVVTVKHTKRDAAIGAVAGATIGAVAGGSKHRIRNAAIGAVVGGVVGGVIGNNVDKSTRVEY